MNFINDYSNDKMLLMLSKLESQHIAICTITRYPDWYPGKPKNLINTDKIRGDATLKTFKHASEAGYTLVVGYSDGEKFNEYLQKILGIFLVKRVSQKRSRARQQIIDEAKNITGIEVILLTEGEKTDLIRFIPEICHKIFEKKADIVIPKRKDEPFKESCPEYMYESEKEANAMINEELRAHNLRSLNDEDLDLFFGPRAFSTKPDIVKLFTQSYKFSFEHIAYKNIVFGTDVLSNANMFPVVLALAKKYMVASVTIPFEYPISIKHNEEKEQRAYFLQKRKAQRIGLIIELMHFSAFLEKHKNRVNKS